jgi:hypothetical protein
VRDQDRVRVRRKNGKFSGFRSEPFKIAGFSAMDIAREQIATIQEASGWSRGFVLTPDQCLSVMCV